MANEIRIKDVAEAAFTMTTASLAADAARSSASITNSNDQPAALISVKVTSGTAPTAGGCYTIYLLRDLGTLATDGWGGSDASFTPVNAKVLGTLVVTNDANTAFTGDFDTSPHGPLGPTFGIAIENNTDQALNSTEGNHAEYYNYYVPEVQ